MGFWDTLRRAFSSEPATPPPAALMREWKFADDTEWLGRELDDSTLQVYADWLEERGDQRFELIRLASTPDQFNAFVKANAAALFGSFAKHIVRPEERFNSRRKGQIEPQWERGVLRGVSVRTEASPGKNVWTDALAFLELPVARTARHLACGIPNGMDPMTGAGDLESLAKYAHQLDEIFIGDFIYPDECEMSWAQLGDVSALWSSLSKLKKVKLRGVVESVGTIDAPELTHFTRETSGMGADEVRAIAAAKLPKLTHLELWFGDENYGCNCTVADIEPLLHAPFGSLTSLALRNFNYLEGLIPRLAATPMLKRVKRLDLSMGTMSDEAVEELLDARSAFAHLDELNLEDNYISGAQYEPLSKLCASVVIGKQREEEDYGRYVAVTE